MVKVLTGWEVSWGEGEQARSIVKVNNDKIINKYGNYSGIHGVALNSIVSRSNWNLEMLVFAEGGKPENPEKNPRSRDENQQQTQPTYDAEIGN